MRLGSQVISSCLEVPERYLKQKSVKLPSPVYPRIPGDQIRETQKALDDVMCMFAASARDVAESTFTDHACSQVGVGEGEVLGGFQSYQYHGKPHLWQP
jgi:hypothetical protein